MRGDIIITTFNDSHYKCLINMDKSFIEYLGYPDFKTIQEVKEYIEKKNRELWVIEKNAEVVGILYTYDNEFESWKKCSIAIGIFSEYRGMGIAKEATIRVLDILVNRGYTRIQVDIELTNYASLKLIEKMNIFELEGTMKNYWGKGTAVNMYSYTV